MVQFRQCLTKNTYFVVLNFAKSDLYLDIAYCELYPGGEDSTYERGGDARRLA